ncbi:hypothetical protein HDU92_000968, partial [Lobulomyces angularis]
IRDESRDIDEICIVKGKSKWNSLRVISDHKVVKSGARTIAILEITPTKGLRLKAERKVRNSQTKPEVPGTAILAKVKIKKNTVNLGIIRTNPL